MVRSTKTSSTTSQFVITQDIMKKIDEIIEYHKANKKQVELNKIIIQNFLSKPCDSSKDEFCTTSNWKN
ncbi:Hypothetical protein SRAE_2000133150 [Strongyloides ratti]|uniref:Uncharacterized protein n=1 Tax=Strongyloides ratti TaxID=34506 RepID=A0A090MY69_STRRB|nr:Hypothetical protein SRAE_2000133150 [Strongyloides ratti]CEF66664.1 Hypothetical protein SRAE_2000133150 [Strongyloides ratti]